MTPAPAPHRPAQGRPVRAAPPAPGAAPPGRGGGRAPMQMRPPPLRCVLRSGWAALPARSSGAEVAADPEQRGRARSYGERLARAGSGSLPPGSRGARRGRSSRRQRESGESAERGERGAGRPARPADPLLHAGGERGWGAGRRRQRAAVLRPRSGETMAKWLNKYFSLGNSKTKSPPQPPRPDYREKRNGAGSAPRPEGPPHLHLHHHTSPGFSRRRLRDDTSDLLRAYRAQKDRDFEDPYSGPGSSLRKLRAMCRPDYSAPEDLGEAALKASSSSSSSSCCATPPTTGSPHLFRSHSERRPATPPDVKYISPKHRLIKVESGAGGSDGAGKKLSKGSKQPTAAAPSAMKDKVSAACSCPRPCRLGDRAGAMSAHGRIFGEGTSCCTSGVAAVLSHPSLMAWLFLILQVMQGLCRVAREVMVPCPFGFKAHLPSDGAGSLVCVALL